MLHEQEPPARTEHAAELAQRAGLVVDRAEHEGGDGDVEALVLERELLGGATDELRTRPLLIDPALQPGDHRLHRLGHRQAPQPAAVHREVRAGAAADLDHVALRAAQQRPAVRRERVALGPGCNAVIACREDAAPESHRKPPGR